MSDTTAASEDLWLFGYGSLIWKPPPHFDRRVPGYVEGYVRRFWQASEDHRGTPEAPGRVVTLIARAHWETLTDQHPSAPPQTWGAAYRIPASHVASVRETLDIREINGYSVEYTDFHVPLTSKNGGVEDEADTKKDGLGAPAPAPIKCLVYIGLPNNPQFLGPQDMDVLAAHVARSEGPSGKNSEYVYNLARALEKLSEEAGVGGGEEGLQSVDEHVAELARRVRREEDALLKERR